MLLRGSKFLNKIVNAHGSKEKILELTKIIKVVYKMNKMN